MDEDNSSYVSSLTVNIGNSKTSPMLKSHTNGAPVAAHRSKNRTSSNSGVVSEVVSTSETHSSNMDLKKKQKCPTTRLQTSEPKSLTRLDNNSKFSVSFNGNLMPAAQTQYLSDAASSIASKPDFNSEDAFSCKSKTSMKSFAKLQQHEHTDASVVHVKSQDSTDSVSESTFSSMSSDQKNYAHVYDNIRRQQIIANNTAKNARSKAETMESQMYQQSGNYQYQSENVSEQFIDKRAEQIVIESTVCGKEGSSSDLVNNTFAESAVMCDVRGKRSHDCDLSLSQSSEKMVASQSKMYSNGVAACKVIDEIAESTTSSGNQENSVSHASEMITMSQSKSYKFASCHEKSEGMLHFSSSDSMYNPKLCLNNGDTNQNPDTIDDKAKKVVFIPAKVNNTSHLSQTQKKNYCFSTNLDSKSESNCSVDFNRKSLDKSHCTSQLAGMPKESVPTCSLPNQDSLLPQDNLSTDDYAKRHYNEKYSMTRAQSFQEDLNIQKLDYDEASMKATLCEGGIQNMPEGSAIAHQKQHANENWGLSGHDMIVENAHSHNTSNTTDFVYECPNNSSLVNCESESPKVISIFRGHVKLKSKAFESSRGSNQNHSVVTNEYNDLSHDLDGIVHDSVEALQVHSHEDRHESQIIGNDATSVDGHVKVKQKLFETLPVDALYEHGQTHSSQIITRGRRKSNLDEVLCEFNTKPLSEINEKEHKLDRQNLHESQRCDEDIPVDNNLVRENAERFENDEFCYKNENCFEKMLTEEEKKASVGLFDSMKGEFENKPLDFIGLDERPERHSSQIIDDLDTCKPSYQDDNDDFVLSEKHSSQQINYHEELFNGTTQVREKRRQYYDYCNSPVQCVNREFAGDSEVLNSSDLNGIVKHTASMYLEEDDKRCYSEAQRTYTNDTYVKPIRNKFETNTISQLGQTNELHPSQCTDQPDGLSEETQRQHRSDSIERPGLHTSQIIDSSEYSSIKSDVSNKTYAFMLNPLSELNNPHSNMSIDILQKNIQLESEVKSKKDAFETRKLSNCITLHPSQVVGHDFHLIPCSETEDAHSGSEKPELHESQKVNYGIIRPPTHPRKQVAYASRNMDDNIQFDSGARESHLIESFSANQRQTYSRASAYSAKSTEDHDEDLDILLNYTPVVKKELPSMVTVMSKGVPDELVKFGQPIQSEYITDSTRTKRISVGSRTSTPVRKPSSCSSRPQSSFDIQCSSRSSTPARKILNSAERSQSYDFVEQTDEPLSPLNNSPPLPSYPNTSMVNETFECVQQLLPPPPLFLENETDTEASISHPDFVQSSSNITGTFGPPDFVIPVNGATIADPMSSSNLISDPEAELSFWTVDQEKFLKEKFSKHSSRYMTSSAESSNAFLRVKDEQNRRISAVTVDSYVESDDQWDC